MSEELTADLRSLRASIAAHSKWAKTDDPAEATAPARKTFLDRFEKQVDPDGTLDPDDRVRRAEHARKAYFKQLAYKSAAARRNSGTPTGECPSCERPIRLRRDGALKTHQSCGQRCPGSGETPTTVGAGTSPTTSGEHVA